MRARCVPTGGLDEPVDTDVTGAARRGHRRVARPLHRQHAGYDDYTVPDPSVLGSLVKQWVIPVAWVLFTVAAVVGYRHFRDGQRAKAAAWIGAYSTSGLISVLHYTDISIDDLSVFQNTFVFLDVLLGLALLGFAVSTAWNRPQPVRA
jgi:hypothetical protein